MNWLLNITSKHAPKENEANIFGAVLYTDANPNIKKALDDKYYWDALNELSGDQWAIFATKSKNGEYGFPDFEPGTMGYMCKVWKEPKENKQLFDTFEIETSKQLPLLVVFAVDEDNDLYQIKLPIDDETKDTAYNSLKDHIVSITESISNIENKNLKSAPGVYSAVSLKISHKENWNRVKKGFELFKKIKSIFEIV